MASLMLGTPVLSMIGAIGAALTLGVRGGSILMALLVLPLYIPVLIFGAGAVEQVMASIDYSANLSLLGAGLLMGALSAPFAVAAALRKCGAADTVTEAVFSETPTACGTGP